MLESAAAVAVIGGIASVAIAMTVKSLIIICQPSEVVIFSGPKKSAGERVGFQALRGGRRIRIPLIESIDRMALTNMVVDVGVRGAYTTDGVPINVQGVANVKIDGGLHLGNAAERLLGKKREEIVKIARETLEANLRGVLAKLTPEQVNEDKESFAQELIEEADKDLSTLGLLLDTLKIQTVSDDVGYLDSIGRKKNAELIRKARIAEAEQESEATVQAANNFRDTRLAQVTAEMTVLEAEANKRIVNAKTKRPAEIANAQSTIVSQLARAEAEVDVQKARIEQISLQLDADLIAPARAYKAEKESEALAQVAIIREQGKATAEGLEELAKTWLLAGDQAREIFLLEKLKTLVGIMVGTVEKVDIDQLTFVGTSPSGDTTAGQVASLVEQLKSGADIDLPALIQRIGVGANATLPVAAKSKPTGSRDEAN
jgi:flotillin